MNDSFLSKGELKKMGFKKLGNNVLISKNACFYGIEQCEIGNNVRIDDFCILSGTIIIGNYVHISAYSVLYGKLGIEMEDFTGLSPRCTIFSASDDFSGEWLIGPMVPPKYTNIIGGKVIIRRFSQIGAGSIIMPGVTISEGVAVGAMSFVRQDLDGWKIYGGNPLKLIKPRNTNIIRISDDFLKNG